jgi:hypothetical protein
MIAASDPASRLTILQHFAEGQTVSEFAQYSPGELSELTGYQNPGSVSPSVIARFKIKCFAKIKVMKAKALIEALNEN